MGMKLPKFTIVITIKERVRESEWKRNMLYFFIKERSNIY